jgi:alpha-glucosidase
MLHLYRALAHLRRAEPALAVGAYETVATAVPDIFAYRRSSPDGHGFLVVLNFGGQARVVDVSTVGETAVIAIASDMQRSGRVDLAALAIGPDEGLVLHLA